MHTDQVHGFNQVDRHYFIKEKIKPHDGPYHMAKLSCEFNPLWAISYGQRIPGLSSQN